MKTCTYLQRLSTHKESHFERRASVESLIKIIFRVLFSFRISPFRGEKHDFALNFRRAASRARYQSSDCCCCSFFRKFPRQTCAVCESRCRYICARIELPRPFRNLWNVQVAVNFFYDFFFAAFAAKAPSKSL